MLRWEMKYISLKEEQSVLSLTGQLTWVVSATESNR